MSCNNSNSSPVSGCHRHNNNTWLETNSVSSLAPLKYFSTLNYFPAAMLQPIILPCHFHYTCHIAYKHQDGDNSLLSEWFVAYDHFEDWGLLFVIDMKHMLVSLSVQVSQTNWQHLQTKIWKPGWPRKNHLFLAIDKQNWKICRTVLGQKVKGIKIFEDHPVRQLNYIGEHISYSELLES